ncbi:MAG TPA: sensor histidine kinase [Allosphingosinicella sp.]|jgi:signal transduction histidine kinase
METEDRLSAVAADAVIAAGERALLRKIDHRILGFNDDTPVQEVEELFVEIAADLRSVHAFAGPAGFLVYMESEFQPLVRSGDPPPFEPVPVTPTLATFVTNGGSGPSRLVEAADDTRLFEVFVGASSCLLAPIHTPAGDLLCLLVAAAETETDRRQLRRPAFQEAVADIAAQLSIAYRQFERAGRHARMQALWGEFVANDLSPSACFRSLARRIPEFLPTFGPLGAVDRTPSSQILMVPETAVGVPPDYLVIRAMTGSMQSSTRVAVRRSISGLLIEYPDLPFFCGDPTYPQYSERYKNYFDDPEHEARTELAVRMNVDNSSVGIINIESRYPDAFSFLHRQTLLELADTFGRLAAVFEDRMRMNTAMQNSISTSTQKYLDALAKTYRHGIRTPLSAQKLGAELLEQQIEDVSRWVAQQDLAGNAAAEIAVNIEDLRHTQVQVLAVHETIASYSRGFIDDISGYAVETQLALRTVVESAVHLAYNCLLAGDAKYITIDIVASEEADSANIYCSTLIKQHLYTVFDNAVEATVARMKEDGRPGRITVTLSEEVIPKGQEQELNEGWIVRIRDNGHGVTQEQLVALRKFDPGVTFKAGGSGYGLVAAQRYIASIGGRVELDSVGQEYFEVALHFAAYKPRIHNEVRPMSEGSD